LKEPSDIKGEEARGGNRFRILVSLKHQKNFIGKNQAGKERGKKKKTTS